MSFVTLYLHNCSLRPPLGQERYCKFGHSRAAPESPDPPWLSVLSAPSWPPSVLEASRVSVRYQASRTTPPVDMLRCGTTTCWLVINELLKVQYTTKENSIQSVGLIVHFCLVPLSPMHMRLPKYGSWRVFM